MADTGLRLPRADVPLLTPWGVSPDADLVYRTLAEYGPQNSRELARALGLPARRVRVALDELTDHDAVRAEPDPRGSDARQWRSTPPDAVLAAIRRRHATRAPMGVNRTLSALAAPAPELRVDLTHQPMARALYGVGRTRARLAELVHTVRHEHLSMHPEPAFSGAVVKAAAPLDHELIARRVRMLTLGVPASVEDATAAHSAELTRHGLEYRELPTLPTKMIIFDRRTAIIPLDPAAPARGAVELFAPDVVGDLATWFMSGWAQAAAPASPAVAPTVHLTERERRIVALLAAGHTDASAAEQLGLSQRTVAYVVRGLMDRLHVQNRFQLGLMLGRTRRDDEVAPPGSES
jgi:DNA-binding CsgD family transcriptional regulator/sugar-specific transcriptional regulator TrmB